MDERLERVAWKGRVETARGEQPRGDVEERHGRRWRGDRRHRVARPSAAQLALTQGVDPVEDAPVLAVEADARRDGVEEVGDDLLPCPRHLRSGQHLLDDARVLELGAMSSPMLKLKGPKMAASEHAPNFPLKWMQKDLRFALATAESVAQPLPVAAAANAAYVRAVAAGSGDLDFSAVVETCRPRG